MPFGPHEIVPLSSRTAYQTRWLRLREDRVRRADGSEGIYSVIERPDFVVVVAWAGGCVTLVEQYRYPLGRRLWELPMGTLEERPDAPPLEVAAAELRQETGLRAGRLAKMGEILPAPGVCNQTGHVFLATELEQGAAEPEATELGMVARAVPLAEVDAMIRDGRLSDALTLASIGLLRVLGKLPPPAFDDRAGLPR